ncbi:methyl-accepting chemotaxis protein [Paenibacillus campi]|uniref:methyl-accepting chemotaxis protein n=1 Tax=Paenibacillus campi TaxID=3106031 RepID=UPI002AFF2C74|nr:methyl-accepting chemotaxis protein [Paenibacillus sp. SGZ-1009]
MKLSIQMKLIAGFAAVILLLVAIAAISIFGINGMRQKVKMIDTKAMPSVTLLGIMNGDVSDVERLMLSVGIERNPAQVKIFQGRFDSLLHKIGTETPKLKALLQSEEELTLYDRFTTNYNSYIALVPDMIKAGQANDLLKLSELHSKAYPLWYTANSSLTKLINLENDNASVTTSAAANLSQQTIFNVIIISLLAILAGLAIALIISALISRPIKRLQAAAEQIADGDLSGELIQIKNRDEIGMLANAFNSMSGNLRRLIESVATTSETLAASSEQLMASSEQNTDASRQIAGTIGQIAEGSNRQVELTTRSSQAMQEMSLGVEQIATRAQTVSGSAAEAASKSADGNEAIRTAVAQMDSIQSSMSSLSKIVQELSERSQTIGNISDVITGISSQTNLLALNAAIEAARAGDAGRGFAVVADEVRKLAEQAADSARQITELVTAIQKETYRAIQAVEVNTQEVSKGIASVSVAGTAFENILTAVNKVAGDIEDVSAGTEQMSASTEELMRFANEIARITEETSAGTMNVSATTEEQLASMEEITSSSTALAATAEQLQAQISEFKI